MGCGMGSEFANRLGLVHLFLLLVASSLATSLHPPPPPHRRHPACFVTLSVILDFFPYSCYDHDHEHLSLLPIHRPLESRSSRM